MKSFDNKLYLKLQSENIQKRISEFDKLYLEIGGKLFDDHHAKRVLRGFELTSKINVLSKFKNDLEVLIVINANDIDTVKIRGDINISYEDDVLLLVEKFKNIDFSVNGVVITHYANQYAVDVFKKKLNNLGINVYMHYPIAGYPHNTSLILSPDGFGKNEYIKTTKKLIIVTAPGPGSGKMATCLSQLYQDNTRGVVSGYAKYETFPVWNLPLKHPVNLAYEAATADLEDVNMIDYYHKEKYGVDAVNYNRDLEAFPVLKQIFERIYGESPYYSPTDMGVNMVGFGIVNDEAAIESSKQEVIRRYLDTLVSLKKGTATQRAVDKIVSVMSELGLSVADRRCVQAALDQELKKKVPCSAIELSSRKIFLGKESDLLTSAAAAVINALKSLAHIPDDIPLLSHPIIEPIQMLKKDCLHRSSSRLDLEEVLIALSITATTNATSQKALSCLPKLKNAQLHSTVILYQDEIKVLKSLGIDCTMEPIQRKFYLGK